jgi:hypothetical protein
MKKTLDTETSELPTTFQLAQLALMVRSSTPKIGVDESVSQAFDLWYAASYARETRKEARQQLKELQNGVFKFKPDEWAARVDDYKGDKSDILKMLTSETKPTTEVVLKLYPDKNNSSKTRKVLTNGLINEFADKHGIKYDGGMVGDVLRRFTATERVLMIRLTADTLPLGFCRWLYEARLKQISINMQRGYRGDKVNSAAATDLQHVPKKGQSRPTDRLETGTYSIIKPRKR